MAEERKRIELIDALRGLSIILMVFYHMGFDLVVLFKVDPRLINNTLLDVLQKVFAGVFVAISGFSSRYSRSNLRRGVQLALLAGGVTVVTYLFSTPILIDPPVLQSTISFGILHFLAVATLLYAAVRRVTDRLPGLVAPILWGSLAAAAFAFFPRHTELSHLWALGLYDSAYATADYFPILPWIFVYMFGTWLGGVARRGELPGWFYTLRIPFLPRVGRHTLAIYLVHQPVLFGLMLLIQAVQRAAA